MFFILVAISLLIVSAFVLGFKRRHRLQRRFRKANVIEEFASSLVARREESSAKNEFVIEDLPYHQKRIYLHGENTYSRPWRITNTFQESEN